MTDDRSCTVHAINKMHHTESSTELCSSNGKLKKILVFVQFDTVES